MYENSKLSLFEQGTIEDLIDMQLLLGEEIYLAKTAIRRLNEAEYDEPGSVCEDYMSDCKNDLARLQAQMADIAREIEVRRDN